MPDDRPLALLGDNIEGAGSPWLEPSPIPIPPTPPDPEM